MKFAICDDEKFYREELKKALEDYGKQRQTIVLCDVFTTGFELLASTQKYDIIFLDYQMDAIDGLKIAKKLREKNDKTEIVFVSSHPQVVFETFQFGTFRFLVKPVEKDKLFAALDDYQKNLSSEEYLMLKLDEETKKIAVSDIIYAEAADKHCYIRTTSEEILYKKTLSELETQISADYFFRSHRSYLVNFQHIASHTTSDILFENGEKALISKMKATAFKNAFLAYIKRKNFT